MRDRSLLTQAAIQTRRGLQLQPFSTDGRLLLAEIERLNGFDAKYVRELELAQAAGGGDGNGGGDSGGGSQFIADRIETVTDLISSRPASEWNVDQFTVNRDSVTVGVLINRTRSRVDIDSTLETIGGYLADVLRFSERIDAAEEATVIDAQTPFQITEDIRDYDYVLHCYLTEAQNSVQLVAELISPVSRTVIAAYNATFVGAERYARAVRNVADRVQSNLPLRGQVIGRRQNRVLLNVGRAHGIEPDQQLVTVQAGQLTASDSSLAFRYPDTSEVGRITITEVDDLVAEGTIARRGLFDNFTIGDEVFAPARALPQRTAINSPSPLYDRILQIR